MDRRQISLLALFDVSAAFDTVDHQILLQRLSVSFGLTDKPLAWLRSFLSERTNLAVFGSSRSRWFPSPFGVPQGSVLGPLLYIIYTAGIGALLNAYGLLHQLYADDIQAYVHCFAGNAADSVLLMCRAMDALSAWLASNRLLLNSSKTQFIWLGGGRQLAKVDRALIAEMFPHISFSQTVRDLGVTLDQELSLSQHVNAVTRSCYYQLRQLRVVSRSLSHEAAVVLVHAFVTSRLDHCCSILAGLPLELLGRLDRVLRAAARLVGHIPKYAPVSVYMRDVLHWLPVHQRISYRVAALVRRCLAGNAPSYLRDLCCPVSQVEGRQTLRSSTRGLLIVPFSRTSLRQCRDFSVVGPSIWNELPVDMRLLSQISLSTFCKLLKSYFFRRGWAGSASE
jgi:Reverse transcriptase (RNA-dependent DNA polymerase)